MSVLRLLVFCLILFCSRCLAQSDVLLPEAAPSPKEENPFTVSRNEDLSELPSDPSQQTSSDSRNSKYPMNKGAEDTATKILSRFVAETFDRFRKGDKYGQWTAKLTVEPSTFSLDDRRELTVTFLVKNYSNKLLKIDFPTSQRIEILVRDPSGKVIERWSDDRAFTEQAGVVMINPDERIEYVEKIPTREMEPDVTYTLEVSLAHNPDFMRTLQVTPKGAPKKAPATP